LDHRSSPRIAAYFQYAGANNGDISLPRAVALTWGCTGERQRTNAIKELVNAGWLIRTRRGGLRAGPDLFAVSVKPIDPCIDRRTGLPKHEMQHSHGYLHLWRPERAYLRETVIRKPQTDSHLKKRVSKIQNDDTPGECGAANSCAPSECSEAIATRFLALRVSAVEPSLSPGPALRVSDLYKELPGGDALSRVCTP
jgi:hypothetical protein